MHEFTGRWELDGTVSTGSPVKHQFADGEEPAAVVGDLRMPLREFNRRWLAGQVFEEVPPLRPASGLSLTVAPDLTFAETGGAPVDWFTDDGVRESKAVPFGGRIVTTAVGSFLLLREPVSYAAPYRDTDVIRPRLDDGDTTITDIVAVEGDRLRRTVSVITDGMYTDRIRYEYRRVPVD
ncbi:hypothetical protein [Streptomyces sp. TRM49041]|uniref:hypothetical protein n=1 Tax=Streptomyces sp. TRM49041 TaxID=2603216 RepID=UPI0011EDC042|nr:hypothetical protein [Streptomyces sp. TRM49041]